MAAATKDETVEAGAALNGAGGESAEDELAIRRANASGDAELRADDEATIEQLAGEKKDVVEEDEAGQFQIAGTATGLTLSAGGRKPDHSTAKMRSIKLPVAGQFAKGEKLRFVVDVAVDDVGFRDEKDKGRVIRTRREHTFTPVAITAVPIVD